MSDQRLWGTLAHVSVPFIGFVGPLILFVVFKDRSALIRANAVEALNFSILYLGVALVAALLIPLGVGAVLLPLAGVATLVFCAMGAISANKGEAYKYPLNWRLVR